MIVKLKPIDHLVLCLTACRKVHSVQPLDLQRTKERFGHGVVPGVALSAHLAVEDIDHSKTKTKSPQTNGIAEHFHKTVPDEFYRIRAGVADLIRLKRVEGPLLIGKRTGLEVGIVLVTPFSSMGEIGVGRNVW